MPSLQMRDLERDSGTCPRSHCDNWSKHYQEANNALSHAKTMLYLMFLTKYKKNKNQTNQTCMMPWNRDELSGKYLQSWSIVSGDFNSIKGIKWCVKNVIVPRKPLEGHAPHRKRKMEGKIFLHKPLEQWFSKCGPWNTKTSSPESLLNRKTIRPHSRAIELQTLE